MPYQTTKWIDSETQKTPTIFSPLPKQTVSYINTLNREKVTKYTFTAFNGEPQILTGKYTIKTDFRGESSLRVEMQVEAAKRFKKKNLFGLGWGISYGD